jgi:hypothetical protein
MQRRIHLRRELRRMYHGCELILVKVDRAKDVLVEVHQAFALWLLLIPEEQPS